MKKRNCYWRKLTSERLFCYYDSENLKNNEILKIKNLHLDLYKFLSFDKVLTHIDLKVNKNEIVGVSGSIKSAKSILIKSILGLNKWKKVYSDVFELGHYKLDKLGWRGWKRVRNSEIGFLIPHPLSVLKYSQNLETQLTSFYLKNLKLKHKDAVSYLKYDIALIQANRVEGEQPHSVEELNKKIEQLNVEYNQAINPEVVKAHLLETLNFVGLENVQEALTKNVDQLSADSAQKALFAKSLLLKPKLLVIDEPLVVLNALPAEEVLSLVKKVRDELNISVLLGSENLNLVTEVCDYVYILENGRIVEKAAASSLRKKLYHPDSKKLAKISPKDLNQPVKEIFDKDFKYEVLDDDAVLVYKEIAKNHYILEGQTQKPEQQPETEVVEVIEEELEEPQQEAKVEVVEVIEEKPLKTKTKKVKAKPEAVKQEPVVVEDKKPADKKVLKVPVLVSKKELLKNNKKKPTKKVAKEKPATKKATPKPVTKKPKPKKIVVFKEEVKPTPKPAPKKPVKRVQKPKPAPKLVVKPIVIGSKPPVQPKPEPKLVVKPIIIETKLPVQPKPEPKPVAKPTIVEPKPQPVVVKPQPKPLVQPKLEPTPKIKPKKIRKSRNLEVNPVLKKLLTKDSDKKTEE